MVSRPLSSLPPLPRQSDCATDNDLTLVISINAVPSKRLTYEINLALNRSFDRTCSFLGSIDETQELEFRLPDLTQMAIEALARRLIKLRDVRKLAAKRVCPRRGAIYAINLRSYFSVMKKDWRSTPS